MIPGAALVPECVVLNSLEWWPFGWESPLMDYSIRLAQVDEAERIAELNAVVQDLHYRERPDWFKAPEPALFLLAIDEWFQSPLVRLFVAEVGTDLVGYSVGVKDDRPDTALK